MFQSQSNATRAAQFRTLHNDGSILVLPNAWDAASARLAEDCGAKAIATSSAAVSWSHGYPDGESLPTAILIAVTAEIVRAVDVPRQFQNSLTLAKKPSDSGCVPSSLSFSNGAQQFLLLLGQLAPASRPPPRYRDRPSCRRRAAFTGMPLPRRRNWRPDWVPSGMVILARPPSQVGTSMVPPSAAVTNETGARQ
jgi:hypothetical protein